MAWTTPLTAVANATLTAAQWNASVRDNLNETAPGKATVSGSIFVGAGANTIVERQVRAEFISTLENTTSTSYTDLTTPGPSIASLTTGTQALYAITIQMGNTVADASAMSSLEISGASSVSPDDDRNAFIDGLSASNELSTTFMYLETGLVAGSNTFTMKYKVGSGTGIFTDRHLIVIPL